MFARAAFRPTRNPKKLCEIRGNQKDAAPGAGKAGPEQPTRPDFTADDQAHPPSFPGHTGCAALGRFRKGLPRSSCPADARPLALPFDRRRANGAFGGRPAHGMVQSRAKRPGILGRDRCQYRRADWAPFAFISGSSPGFRACRRAYTEYNAGRHFRGREGRPESLVDTWPLKRLIAKEVTPELMAQISRAITNAARPPCSLQPQNLDAQRGVVWNMGARDRGERR